MLHNQLPVMRVGLSEFCELGPDSWPRTLQPVNDLLEHGLDLGRITILVGDNGTGKSTIIEALAIAFGLNAEGGSTFAMHSTRTTESELHRCLRLKRGIGSSREGYFLRAETMHSFYTYLEERLPRRESRYHEMSHGESFLQVLQEKFTSPGFFVLDEPESALSFSGCLALLRIMADLTADGRSQVVVATHSPIVASMPGADIYELDVNGLRKTTWEDLNFVSNYRRFLERPELYHRHVFDDE